MAPKHAIAKLYSSKYYSRKKTKNKPRTTTFAQWSFYKGDLEDNYLPKTTTFEWSEEWSSYTDFYLTH